MLCCVVCVTPVDFPGPTWDVPAPGLSRVRHSDSGVSSQSLDELYY